MSFACLAEPKTYSFIVEFKQNTDTSFHNFSIKHGLEWTDSVPLQGTSTEMTSTSGYFGPDTPLDDKPNWPGGWENLTTEWVSISWLPLFVTSIFNGCNLYLTFKEGSYKIRAFSWRPLVSFVVVGLLSRSHWNPEALIFNQLDEQTPNQEHEFLIITLMDKSNGSHSLQERSYDQCQSLGPNSSTSQSHSPRGFSSVPSGSGDAPPPSSTVHTLNNHCYISPCSGRCAFAPSFCEAIEHLNFNEALEHLDFYSNEEYEMELVKTNHLASDCTPYYIASGGSIDYNIKNPPQTEGTQVNIIDSILDTQIKLNATVVWDKDSCDQESGSHVVNTSPEAKTANSTTGNWESPATAQNTHTGQFVCVYCNVPQSNATALYMHNQKQCGEQCSKCSKLLASKEALKKHWMTSCDHRNTGKKHTNKNKVIHHYKSQCNEQKKCKNCPGMYDQNGMNKHLRGPCGGLIRCTKCPSMYDQNGMNKHLRGPCGRFKRCMKCGYKGSQAQFSRHKLQCTGNKTIK